MLSVALPVTLINLFFIASCPLPRPLPSFSSSAALDPVNVHKVATYVRKRAKGQLKGGAHQSPYGAGSSGSSGGDLQAIVISLKDSFYEKASGIVGVHRDVERNSSGTLTLDLDAFPDGGAGPSAAASSAGGSLSSSHAASPATDARGSVASSGSGSGSGVKGGGANTARRVPGGVPAGGR